MYFGNSLTPTLCSAPLGMPSAAYKMNDISMVFRIFIRIGGQNSYSVRYFFGFLLHIKKVVYLCARFERKAALKLPRNYSSQKQFFKQQRVSKTLLAVGKFQTRQNRCSFNNNFFTGYC